MLKWEKEVKENKFWKLRKSEKGTLLLLVLPSQALKIVFVTHNKQT